MSFEQNILLESGTNELEVLEFVIVHEENGKQIEQHYGINVTKVRKMIQMPELTQPPASNPSIAGLFYSTGISDSYITAIDLKRYLFKTNEFNYGKESIIIITEFNQILSGLIVDSIVKIHRVSWKEVEAPKIGNFGSGESLVVGVFKIEEKNIMMLDVEKIVLDLGMVTMENIHREELSGSIMNKRIVHAEDSPLTQKLIAERLEAIGFEVVKFANGEDAWKYLEDIAENCDSFSDMTQHVNAVITDVEMPIMDGYTLTKKIKTHPLLNELPVLIFSSMINEDILHKGQAVGADMQLSKPQIGELSEMMISAISDKAMDD